MAQDQTFGGYPLDVIAKAIMQVESSGGIDKRSRYEPGFERRYKDRYLQQDPQLWQAILNQYQPRDVFSSYGPYQVMYPIAVELGYRGSPADLADPNTNRAYFEKKFMRDWKGSKGDLDKALTRYNGSPTYIPKVRKHLPPLN